MELVRQESARGSALLSALVASFLGVTFTMTYLHFSRYIAAKSAVDEALRAAARCLVTTDGGCAEATPPSAGSLWDYNLRVPGHRTDILADRYEYRANLVTAHYAAEYTSYEIPKIFEPKVQWTSYSVPVHRLQTLPPLARRMQSYERDVLHEIDSGYQPAANPNFPVFRDELVEHPTLDRSIESWHSRYAAFSGDAFNTRLFRYAALRRLSETSGAAVASLHIQKNAIETLVSDWIYVPPLESTPIQRCAPGFSCGAAIAAGCSSCNKSDNISIERNGCGESCADFAVQSLNGSTIYGLTNGFTKQAFLAVKAFAYVSAQSQTTSFGWGESRDRSDNGLAVEVATSPDPRAKFATYSLGGRLNSNGLAGGTWRNLVLRGPAGSNGGTVDHQHIGVPRGSYFRIIARLRAMEGSVNASVALLYYFDDYIKAPANQWTTTHRCPDVEIAPGKSPIDLCPAIEACGVNISNDFRQSSCRLIGAPRTTEYICSTDTSRYFELSTSELALLPEPMRGRSYHAVVCSKPAAEIGQDANPSDGCGPVSSGISGAIETSIADGSCPTASARANERLCSEPLRAVPAPCGAPLPDPEEVCPWTASVSEFLAVRAAGGDSAEHPAGLGTLAFIQPKFRWGEVKQAESGFSWTPAAPEGSAYACAVPIPHRAESGPQVLRKDPLWSPPLDAFAFTFESQLSSSDENFRRAVRISQIPGSQQKLPITTAYPFSKTPEVEISDFTPVDPGNLDSCSPGPEAPLETRLRAYASAERKEALDPDIVFEWSAQFRDTAILEHLACGESSKQLPVPENCKKIYAARNSSVCPAQTIYLGRYSADEFSGGPPICESGQAQCERTFAGYASPQGAPAPSFNIDRARLAALAALNGVLGKKNAPAKVDCSTPDCLNLAFDLTETPKVKVEANYQMPLLFPIDVLTGQSSIKISRRREEPVEISMLVSAAGH